MLVLLLALGSCPVLLAQQAGTLLEVGAGAQAYRGDLREQYSSWRGHWHLGLQFNGPKKVNASVNLNAGSLLGQELNYEVASEPLARPNTFFRTSYFNKILNLTIRKFEIL